MARKSDSIRKRIEFDAETWQALDGLARDRMASIQELADEAFRDLLKKHNRPTTLKEMLKAQRARASRQRSGQATQEESRLAV